eukprot:1141385-Pelagomonas_calceolata.AAC.1
MGGSEHIAQAFQDHLLFRELGYSTLRKGPFPSVLVKSVLVSKHSGQWIIPGQQGQAQDATVRLKRMRAMPGGCTFQQSCISA